MSPNSEKIRRTTFARRLVYVTLVSFRRASLFWLLGDMCDRLLLVGHRTCDTKLDQIASTLVRRCNCNYILFTKLPWPGDSEGTFRSSSQTAACPPVYHTRPRLHTVPLIAERQAGKLWISIFRVFGLVRPGIEPESTTSVADTLSTQPLIGSESLRLRQATKLNHRMGVHQASTTYSRQAFYRGPRNDFKWSQA